MVKIIELNDINVFFKQDKKEIKAVNNTTLHVDKGDIYSVVGYSGAGKSTLARTINLLQIPTSGEVKVSDSILYEKKEGQAKAKVVGLNDLRKKRRKIGMIFQHFNLLNEQTILQNIVFALRHSGLNAKDMIKKAADLLELVGLENRKDAYPAQLSGGQQQRVAIARALANDPEILISDEGTSALDPKNTAQILDLLKKLNEEMGLTIILITHEMDAVKRIANKVAVMNQGKIIERGDLLQIFTNPKEKLTREFVGNGYTKAIETLKEYHLDNTEKDEKIVQLTYVGKTVSEPLLVKLYKDFDVEANIIYSNIEILRGTPVGTLIVTVSGEEEGRKKALEYLKKHGLIITNISKEKFN